MTVSSFAAVLTHQLKQELSARVGVLWRAYTGFLRHPTAGLLSFINRRHGRHGFTLVIGVGADGGPPTWHASCHQSSGPLAVAVLHASLGQCPALFKSCALLDLETINVQNYLGMKI
jgi:hypothetical protein